MVPVSSALIEHLAQGDDHKDGAKVKSIPLLSSLGKYVLTDSLSEVSGLIKLHKKWI